MKKKYLIVVANYYENISNLLLKSALKEIKSKNSVKIIYVPGVFEIPVTISNNLKKFDAISILTDWQLFKEYEWKNLPSSIFILNGLNQ